MAVAQHATGTVTITARDPDNGRSDSVTAVVTRKETPRPTPQPPAPTLQWITIAPARVSGFVNEWKEFTAIGHYTDGTKVNLTSEVEWSSYSLTTDPVLEEPLIIQRIASFPLRRVGGATITAKYDHPMARDVLEATATVTVSERVQPPPPPPPHPSTVLERIEVTPNSVQPVVGETRSFQATGYFADKSKKDLTAAVVWKNTHGVVVFEAKSARARFTSVGGARLTAEHKSGKQGSARIWVLAPASKPKVELPTPGPLTRNAATVLVADLVYLAQPAFMRWEVKPEVGGLTPTGDEGIDRVLGLASYVVQTWNSLDTLAQARAYWQQIHPRVTALLKEAAGPRVGLKAQELQPAHEAIARMTAYLMAEPSGAERVNIQSDRRKNTPFGELRYSWWQEQEVVPLLNAYDDAKTLFPELQSKFRLLDAKEKIVAVTTKPPKDYVKEIQANATKTAAMQAEIFKNAANQVKAVLILLKDFQRRMESASVDVNRAHSAIEKADLRNDAAADRKRGERQVQIIDTCLSVVKLGVSVAVEGPAGAIEAIDVVKELTKLFGENDLIANAERLEDRARAMDLADARTSLAQAKGNLKSAAELLKEAGELVNEFHEDVDRQRAKAEHEFDSSTTGVFRFAHVERAIEFADQTHDLAIRIDAAVDRANDAAEALRLASGKPLLSGSNTPSYDGDAMKIIRAINDAANKLGTEAAPIQKRAEELRQSLRVIRATADQALVTARDPRRTK
jgi:hypothetical protein